MTVAGFANQWSVEAVISCPDDYLCVKPDDTERQICVNDYKVCDGNKDCPLEDDEHDCDHKKCPFNCVCQYAPEGSDVFQVTCNDGWRTTLVENVPKITQLLKLSGGNVPVLAGGIFKPIQEVQILSLPDNRITLIEQHSFQGLDNLTSLDLSYNTFSQLDGRPFQFLLRLEAFVIVRGSKSEDLQALEPKKDVFDHLRKIQTLYVDEHQICCYFDNNLVECTTLEPQPPLFTCGSLMQNPFLRVCMWILGSSAVFGNIFVIAMRVQEKPESNSAIKQRLFIGNLGASDCLMGVYMMIIASADVYYGDVYFTKSEEWRSGIVCKIASFLALLSSEASVFVITLISFDRCLSVVFPFSDRQFRSKSSKMAIGFIWLVSLGLALAPTLLAGPDSDFYDLSDVCIGLPLITRPTSFQIEISNVGHELGENTFAVPIPENSKPAWYFSIAIFLGINLICFVAILICYIMIFAAIKKSAKKVQRKQTYKEDMRLALKMAAIIGTDFICWFPVIVMGLLSQTGLVVIPLVMYIWSVVFILPINSALNPFLYTFASVISDYRSKLSKNKQKKNPKDSSRSTQPGQTTQATIVKSISQGVASK
ncbi:G-protein coupled receptor GRL101-like [Amphiura filiformis]|uniref:G-protein coupled receptor GRL101-like n=1 Tax=Amphiura filiformis TaxID=82378 RepID=UPI003B2117CD